MTCIQSTGDNDNEDDNDDDGEQGGEEEGTCLIMCEGSMGEGYGDTLCEYGMKCKHSTVSCAYVYLLVR